MLSLRFKEAVKTALAMSIAYGIALSMDWDRAYWAGFAVAMVSLSTIGQSLNKAALRTLGTLLAITVSLTFIALFPQERWLFITIVSLWAGLCAYMMEGSRHPYFWQVGCFVTIVICLDAGPDAVNAFDTAVLRAQETGLGILVYGMVSVLLWPNNSRSDFDTAVHELISTQHDLYRAYHAFSRDRGREREIPPLLDQSVQAQMRFKQLLIAAQTDSYEIWELRQQWQRFEQEQTELAQTLERWRESFTETKDLDMERLIPGCEALGDELDARFTEIGRVLNGKSPERAPQAIDLRIDGDAAQGLSHFQRAALEVTRSHMARVDALTRALYDVVCDIRGVAESRETGAVTGANGRRILPNLDGLANSARMMCILWLAFATYIYVPDIPGGASFVTMSGSIGIALASAPQMSVSLLLWPVAFGILFSGSIYIFVMPQLSSFMGVGPLIFAATFIICYLFHTPKQGLGRSMGLILFAVIASITNEQTYSFLSVANTALMFALVFLLLAATAYVPFDLRPERVLLRLLRRFFRSCEHLVATMWWDVQRAPTRLDRWIAAFHARELASLPQKIGAWSKGIGPEITGGSKTEELQGLVNSLQALAYRMEDLLEARGKPHGELIVQELLGDVRAWRTEVQALFRGLATDPSYGESVRIQKRLDDILDHLEARVEASLNKASEGQISDQDSENLYRLLGAYRGVSEATVSFAGCAGALDWQRWRESRFQRGI